MSPSPYLLPERIGKMLSRLPAYPGSHLFALGLNLALNDRLPPDTRRALDGKRLRIQLTDAQLRFDFQWRGDRFHACRHGAEPDLHIGASAHDFLQLARRQEDPDTLFFSRRLTMEGDTELGLMVKNTLDAIDVSVLELGRLAPLRMFERLRSRPST